MVAGVGDSADKNRVRAGHDGTCAALLGGVGSPCGVFGVTLMRSGAVDGYPMR